VEYCELLEEKKTFGKTQIQAFWNIQFRNSFKIKTFFLKQNVLRNSI